MRRWLADRRSLVATVTSGSLVAALIAAIAIVSGGYEAQRLDLGDGSVWVANGSRQVIGRANTEVLELNTIVQSAGASLAVVQEGSEVLLLDRTNSKVDIVDAATAQVSESVPLPPQSTELMFAGENVVVHAVASGAVWIVPRGDLPTFDAGAEPTLTFPADAVATVDPDGTLFLFSASEGKVYRVDATSTDAVSQTSPAEFTEPSADATIASVGGRWVLLDAGARRLSIEGRIVDLSSALDADSDAVLQEAGPASDRVIVAHSGGLLSVPLSGGTPEELLGGQNGSAVRPEVTSECVFAAWDSGIAWRSCSSEPESSEMTLAGVSAGSARLAFATNGRQVVLNDPQSGGTWAVQQGGEAIDNWNDLVPDAEDEREITTDDPDIPPEFEKNQLPPIAEADEFGARPGRASLLPVLLNDYDPNGDVLIVSTVDTIDESVGRIDVINDGQRIQLTLAGSASGSFSFAYSISDGRGGTATATVTVAVRSADQNSPPVQLRASRALVAEGARVSSDVLGDWVDPDGDAFYLASASVPAPDTVSYRPEGVVVFQDGGAGGALRTVFLAVSDGRLEGSGTLGVSVREAGDVPIIPDPFGLVTYAGQEITISPLEHVRGGSGPLRLSSVPAKPGSTIEASLETGTFRFSSDQVRTHYLEYVVDDGDQTATGVIRVDVAAPPDPDSTPITIPKTVFVRVLSSETIDVASSDIDPAGGVLLVTGVDALPVDVGVRAVVLDQRSIRVTLTAPLDQGPVTFGYRITNGLAEASGVVTVVEIPPLARMQTPVAADDAVTVRVGDAIDIAVLANDVHPDGEELTLNPVLTTGLGGDSGLLFTSGDSLRYLAPQGTGNFTAVYEVAGPDGQVDQAEVSIAVREAVAETNAAPVAPMVVARVIAGSTVRVMIPLDGIDPDGDSVQLLGQETNPQKGAVTEVGADFFSYSAGDYNAGTDSFTYTVVDALGARATGTVRIGISPRTAGASNPVAIEDLVVTRPGKTVSIQALANDSDPNGSALSIESVEPNSPDIVAEIDGELVKVTPPSTPGRYGLVYTIQNSVGGTSSSFIVVEVDPDARPAYPIARDTVLSLSDVSDRDTVVVDVLRNVFFADGDVSSLELSVLPGYRDVAAVTPNKRIRIEIAERRQIIPFAVANPDDASVVSYAFVWVPGFEDALPQLDRSAPRLRVVSENAVTIDINKYVIAVGGKRVSLIDTTTVAATHANGDDLVVDGETLRFTSADRYFGPASISFTVTDGESADDPSGRTATLVLPIEVTPRENQPPVFVGGIIDFEPGESKTLDLLRLTTYSNPEDIGELQFTATGNPPSGFDYTITGATLEIRARAGIARGSASALTIGVSDSTSTGQPGRIDLEVVSSTRPLAQPATDDVVVPRGKVTTIDVLANDEATNPFPGEPLEVVDVRGIDGGSLPAGVSVSPSSDNRRLTVTVADSALPIDSNLQYRVADVTNDPERYAYGSVRISVQDRPDAPVAPSRADGGYEEGLLTLRLTPPAANNSPITKYEVVSSSHGDYRKDCGTNLRCALTDLQPGLRYQFSVIATNAIGASDQSPVSAVLSADYLPAAPTSVTAVASDVNPSGAALDVSWAAVANPNPGSAITGYTMRITGAGTDFTATFGASTTSTVTTAGRALVPNAQYVVTVYAENSALVLSDADWRRASSSPVTTIGPPSQTAGGVSAVVANASGHILVEWGASSPNGGQEVTYSVGRIPVGTAVPGSCVRGGAKPGVGSGKAAPAASGWIDTSTDDGDQYQYVVYAENELFCTPTSSGAVETKVAPGAARAVTVVQPNGGQADLRVTDLEVQSGTAVRFEARLGGGQWFPVARGAWLTSAANAGVYGNPVTVEYRGCRDDGAAFCGAPSAATTLVPLNARGSILTCEVGTVPQPIAPVNGGSASYRFLYSYDTRGGGAFTPYAESAVAPEPDRRGDGVTHVRMKTVVSLPSGQTYEDGGYAEADCTEPPE